MTLSEIFEGLTAIGLFMSVALVFSELRRNGMEARLNNWINYTQRVFDARNTVVDLDIADIIVWGRKNLQNLSETEQLVFKKYLLNSALTAMSFTVLGGRGRYGETIGKEQCLRLVKEEWDNDGAREYWAEIRTNPPMVNDSKLLVDKALGF
jgi:hypothetical protein